jgi:hypothetical protein
VKRADGKLLARFSKKSGYGSASRGREHEVSSVVIPTTIPRASDSSASNSVRSRVEMRDLPGYRSAAGKLTSQ